MTNNDDMPQVILEEWAASIRWLKAHPEAMEGKRALAAMVAVVVERARVQGKAAEGAEGQGKEGAKIMIIKSGTDGRYKN